MKPLVSIKNLERSFESQKVLKGISIDFPYTGLFVIVGASGSGKSTLLNILSGLDVGYKGECKLGKYSFKNMNEDERARFRLKHIGYVFQDFKLLELETPLANVLMPLDALSRASPSMRKRKALDLLSSLGIEDKAYGRTALLSGGEKQRVAIARALINDPSIVLADEPTGALDEKNANYVFSYLKALAKRRLVIVVSHDETLSSKYADRLIRIKDGQIDSFSINGNERKEELPFSLTVKGTKKNPRLSISFLLGHGYRLLKAKKKRSIIAEVSIAIGMVGLGMSNYVSNSISSELGNAFSSIVEQDQIAFSLSNPSSTPIGNVYSAPINTIENLAFSHPDSIKDYGCSYLVNFEEFYKDSNTFSIYRGSKQIVVPFASIRSVNDYLWLDDFPNITCYPNRPSVMENDQVVIGLPYSSMFNICYGLQILRNYESLGNYIIDNGLVGVFELANYDWSYEDEQLLSIVAVVPSDSFVIYHLNHHWASFMFEETMRFPSSDHKDTTLPWIMNKVHYIEPSGEFVELLHELRNEKENDSLVFEPCSFSYNQSNPKLNRAYVYSADKFSLAPSQLVSMKNEIEPYGSIVVTTSASYVSVSSSLLNGMALKFFVSATEESADVIIDSYSRVKKEDADLDYSIPDDSFDGSYIKSAAGGLKIYPKSKPLIEGRYPVGIEEVAITKPMKEKLGNISTLCVVGQIGESSVGSYIEREFSKARVKVVGVVDSQFDGICVDDYWSMDFFELSLGMSAFSLEPTGGIITLKAGQNKNQVIAELSRKYRNLRFVDPSETVTSSIEGTIGYVSLVLSVFSYIALAISALLFVVVTMISVSENKKEASLLHVIGLSKKDISNSNIAQSFLLLTIATMESLCSMVVAEYLIHGFISSSFSSKASFSLSFEPLVIMVSFSVISFLILSIGLRLFTKFVSFE